MMLAFGVAAAVAFAACARKAPGVDPKKFNSTWQSAQSQHFIVWTPPHSPRTFETLAKFGEACDGIWDQVVRVLELKPPDSISLYLFTTNQDCEAATGHGAGFVEGFNVFTNLGAPVGGVIAEACCNSIDPEARSFPLVRNGVRVLFEQRDRNLHEEAAALRAAGRLPKLADLIAGTPVNDKQAYDVASASFLSYLIARHGTDQFKMLWKSVLELRPSLERIYGGTIDQMDGEWNHFLDREAKRT